MKIFKSLSFKIFLVFTLPLNLFAWTLISDPSNGVVKFPVKEITFNVSGDSCDGTGFTNAQMLDLLDEAMDEFWNGVSTSALVLKKGSVISTTINSDGDTAAELDKIASNTILIGCSNSTDASRFPNGSSTAGLGGITKFSNGKVVGRVFISRNNSTVSGLSARQRLAVIAHEVGHAIGLGHSSNKVSLMYYSVGAKLQEHLTGDDWDGVTYLYPHDSPGSCSSLAFINPKNNSGNKTFNQFFFTLAFGFMLAGLSRLLGKTKLSKLRVS